MKSVLTTLKKTPQKSKSTNLLIVNSPQPKDKARYGGSYYGDKIGSMGKGYTHPYHTEDAPLFMSTY